MNKPHIKISVYDNVPVWRVVWPDRYERDSWQGCAAASFTRAKNRERMPEGFGRAWQAANPGVCDCMMPLPMALACSQLRGPHSRSAPPLRMGVTQ